MIEIDVTVQNAELLPNYELMIANAFPYTLGVVQSAAQPVIEEMLPYLQREPGPVSLPFHWTSAKQRHWYFANRKGKIPYIREHKLSRGYKVAWNTGVNQSSLEVSNEAADVWPFVKGPWQQIGHWYTQWDNDLAAFMYYGDKLWQLIVPAVTAAWSPENVVKMANATSRPLVRGTL